MCGGFGDTTWNCCGCYIHKSRGCYRVSRGLKSVGNSYIFESHTIQLVYLPTWKPYKINQMKVQKIQSSRSGNVIWFLDLAEYEFMQHMMFSGLHGLKWWELPVDFYIRIMTRMGPEWASIGCIHSPSHFTHQFFVYFFTLPPKKSAFLHCKFSTWCKGHYKYVSNMFLVCSDNF